MRGKLTSEDRRLLRRERSKPVLEKIRRLLLNTVAKEPPSSDLAKAASYGLNHWGALTRFVVDGRLSLDNNLCERQLRAIAVGRKNYLFAGSPEGTRRAVTIYTVLQSAILHGIAPLPYLTDALRKLNSGTPVADLLPHRFVELTQTAT
ncbi:MAG TPA: transposase [Gemmatimonadaceae bacterium]